MVLKSIPITDKETIELYIQAKKKFVNENIPKERLSDNNIIKEALKSYLGVSDNE